MRLQQLKDTQIHPDMPYKELLAAVTANKVSVVPNGNGLIKSGQPVSKLIVVPMKESNRFAVIFSMSHTVADGHTYYTILDMLSSTNELFPMEIERDEKYQDSIPAQIGEDVYKFMMSPGLCMICHYMGVMAKANNDPPQCFLIDQDKLKKAKEDAKAESGAAAYVTTNDVITSGFAKAVNAKMLTMAINFRGRLDGLTARHAGNYHSGVIWGPDGSASPNGIRNSLNGPAPLSCGTLPGGCCISGNWSAMITNWSTMSKGNLEIPDCTQTLHLPYLNTKEMKEDACVIFKARPGQVAVMLFLQSGTVADAQMELPLGEPVSAKMFGCK